jgi:hypothetical protein
MNKNYLGVALFALVVIAGVWYVYSYNQGPDTDITQNIPPVVAVTDVKNATYVIEGVPAKLINGKSEVAIASSSAKVVTQYFGNDATGDLNNDGLLDTAFLLSQNTGGSGTFYYVVVALKSATGYQGTNAVLLGDRIAPQTTQIQNGEVIVNYAVRKAGEPMTTRPSLGVSKYLKIQGQSLVEVVK